MCNVQLIPTLVASSTVHSDNLDPELSYEIGISGASSLADILRVEMSLLCFFPLLLILKKCTNYAEESAHYACMPRQKKFTTVGDSEWLIRVLFYTLLGFHSVQFCPTASAFPARRVSHDFTLSLKVRGPRQACSIMKRLVRRVLGRAPGNPLVRLYQTR